MSMHVLLFFVIGLILLLSFFVKRKDKTIIQLLHSSQVVFLIAYLSLLLSGSAGGYDLVFFLVPFLIFIQEEPCINRYNITEYLIYLVCLLPAGINEISYPFFILYLIGGSVRLMGKRHI